MQLPADQQAQHMLNQLLCTCLAIHQLVEHLCFLRTLLPADDVACDSMLQQLQQCDLQGKVIINHSTNTPEFAMAAAAQMRGRGCDYLAAPVWGRWGQQPPARPPVACLRKEITATIRNIDDRLACRLHCSGLPIVASTTNADSGQCA
jgi:hypothetical protein